MLTAVSSTVATRTDVITISPQSAFPYPTPGEMTFAPRVPSFPLGMVAMSSAEPRIAPMIWEIVLAMACPAGSWPTRASAKVTAGLSWPPEIWPVAKARTVMASPNANATVTPQLPLMRMSEPKAVNDSWVFADRSAMS